GRGGGDGGGRDDERDHAEERCEHGAEHYGHSRAKTLERTLKTSGAGLSRPQRTVALSSAEGLKRGVRPATATAWPVLGLRSVRGRRRATENVPKPTSVTGSPRRSAPRTATSMARKARSVGARGPPAACDRR